MTPPTPKPSTTFVMSRNHSFGASTIARPAAFMIHIATSAAYLRPAGRNLHIKHYIIRNLHLKHYIIRTLCI